MEARRLVLAVEARRLVEARQLVLAVAVEVQRLAVEARRLVLAVAVGMLPLLAALL